MKSKVKVVSEIFNHYYPLFIGVIILISIVIWYALFNDSFQIFNYDMAEQGIRFILNGWEKVNSNRLSFWDWNLYTGASIFVHIHYFLMSPFWLLFLLLPEKDLILQAFLYVNMLKHILLFITSFLYFKSIRQSNLAIFAGASIITFSGFALGHYNYSHYTDVLLVIPLILLFTERFISENKYLGLILSISLAAFIDIYLLILFAVYIFLYALFRYIDLTENIDSKKIIKKGLQFIFIFILGILISSISVIPNLEILFSTSRISIDTSLFDIISKYDLFRYLTGFLQPVVDRNNFNPLISKFIVESFGHSGGAAVYSLIISPILISQLYFIKKKTRNLIFIFYGILIIASFFPSLYFLMQGNQDTRWMVMFVFLNAFTISLILDDLNRINYKFLMISAFIIGLLEGFAYIISRQLTLQNVDIYFEIAKRNILLIWVFICIYLIAFLLKNRKLKVILIVIVLIAESYLSLYNIFFNPLQSVAIPSNEIENYQITNQSIIDAIKDYDNGVYRIDAIEDYSFNNPMGKDYLGLTFYTSVYNYAIDDFIQNNVASAGGWVVGGNASKWEYKEMFGTKYWFDTTGLFNAPYGYSYVFTVDYTNDQTIDVYVNNYFIPLLYTSNNDLSYDVWKTLTPYYKNSALLNHVVLMSSVNTDIDNILDIKKLSDFREHYEHNFDQTLNKKWITIEFPRSEEVYLKSYLKGEEQESFWTWEPNYATFYLEKDFDSIEVSVTNIYGVPSEEFINTLLISDPNERLDNWYANKKSNSFTDIKFGKDTFSAYIKNNFNNYAVTSISYDKYWQIYVNGNKVETLNVNGGFIGFEIPLGEVEITSKYVPLSFYIGLIISILSILFLSLFMVIKNNRIIQKWF